MVNVFTEKNFKDEVLNNENVVLVDFFATWCNPCKMMAPIVEEISNENPNVKVGKVNVDEEIGLAETYGIMSIPTLMIFKDGKNIKTFIGVTDKEEIVKALKQ